MDVVEGRSGTDAPRKQQWGEAESLGLCQCLPVRCWEGLAFFTPPCPLYPGGHQVCYQDSCIDNRATFFCLFCFFPFASQCRRPPSSPFLCHRISTGFLPPPSPLIHTAASLPNGALLLESVLVAPVAPG